VRLPRRIGWCRGQTGAVSWQAQLRLLRSPDGQAGTEAQPLHQGLTG
jgi:hypothetical protein